jgi:hypothetical protein
MIAWTGDVEHADHSIQSKYRCIGGDRPTWPTVMIVTSIAFALNIQSPLGDALQGWGWAYRISL